MSKLTKSNDELTKKGNMEHWIAILGENSAVDIDSLTAMLGSRGFTVKTFLSGWQKEILDTAGLPVAFVNIAPPEFSGILNLFGILPVSTGERIPFFQFVNERVPEFTKDFPLAGFITLPLTDVQLSNVAHYINRNSQLVHRSYQLGEQLAASRKEVERLVEIGTALSSENDITKLLDLILTICRKAVGADAGSVYVRERSAPGGALTDSLLFMVSQNESIDTKETLQYRLPVNNESIAGYVAGTGVPLNIPDVSKLPKSSPYKTKSVILSTVTYRITSMLTMPLVNLRKQVVGVLQLINRKQGNISHVNKEGHHPDQIIPFSKADEQFVLSVAQLAAVSLERAQLYESVTTLFEGMLDASVTSIDERDKVTSGHSRRVMRYAMAFVDTAEEYPGHAFHELCSPPERRRQFQIAAQLHDIGKIGVPEFILTKENRLPKDEFNVIMANFDYIEMQLTIHPEKVSWKSVEEVIDDRQLICRINRLGRISDEDAEAVKKIAVKSFVDIRGSYVQLLSAYAVEALTVRRGNLTAMERDLVNSHALSTRRILSRIPWTSELSKIPEIAAQHHERVNGSGYPDGLTGREMLLESRILAVIDIYEALVAQDRPYKPKMTPETAIGILRSEAAEGAIDKEVVDFFITKNIYRLYCNDDEGIE